MSKLSPQTIRDFSRGRISKSAANNQIIPENSVSDSLNVNFDTVLGSGQVRLGTTKLGSTVAASQTPLGLTTYTTSNLTTNLVVGVFSGASNATVYYYNGSWNTSGVTNLDNTSKNRFASLGGRIFRVNGVTAMQSSSNGNVWNTTNSLGVTTSHIVGLVFRQKNRLIAAGDTVFPSRVWFSSVINPGATTTLTWAEGSIGGDFIDINPDDGDYITAFAETSTLTLVFKSNAIYRLNVISKTVDTENIFNVGAVSQEAVVRCQGAVYFFSGKDIRRTAGDLPQQISRLGVQDYIDAMSQSAWSNVAAGTDGWNVYFSIGNITLNTGKNEQETIKNVVLKFSTRDESWSVHSYQDQFRFFQQYTTSANGQTLIGSETTGDVQTLNLGQTDNGKPIFYKLDTQDLEFGLRQNVKEISDKVVAFTDNGENSRLQVSADDNTLKDVPVKLIKRVNVGRDVNVRGNYFKFRWMGESTGNSPVFEGLHLPDISDSGIN